MTMTSVRLAGSLQTLIDSRLDTIERMLMGRVPRQDRLAIVKDVETQIFDILQESGTDEPTREDVLAALARLDPPEAYLPEDGEMTEAGPAVVRRPVTARAVAPQRERAEYSRAGTISGILGLATTLLSALGPPVVYVVAYNTTSQSIIKFLSFGILVLMFCGSLVGLVLAIVSGFRGVWSILGGVLSPISLLYSIVAAVFLGMILVG
jgi:hypothetical protein